MGDLAKQTKAGGDNKPKAAENAKLQEFYNKSFDITTKIKKDSEACQKSFEECAEYFGEGSSSKTDLSVFFGYFTRFINAWKAAEKNKEVAEPQSKVKVTMRNKQNDLINELNQRNRPTQSISPQDIQDGQFENIILGMKSEPYRHGVNGDIHRRSYRRQRSSNSHRLTDES